MTSKLIAADWIVPVTNEPIRNGVVVVEGSKISWLGPLDELPTQWADAPVERRAGVLMPGLVNAHTHLQYTHFDEVGRGKYTSFEHWSDVFAEVYDAVLDPEEWRVAALDGAHQAVQTGTTVFAEIVTNDEARGAVGAVHAGGIEYLEAIGEFNSRWESESRSKFLAWLAEPSEVLCGISPHAPYSLDGDVITELVAIAAERGMRVHSHLGESSVEADLYREGVSTVLTAYGDLRDEFELVRRGGVGNSIAGYADSIGLLNEHTHVAHGIYLERYDRDLALKRGTQIALCPRSNMVIGLDAAPVAAYLLEGHEIAVGTDSLASAPSLDLMADVRELAVLARAQGYTDDDLDRRLIRAATLGGSMAMGLDNAGYGTLAVGGPADLAVFDVTVTGGNVEAALVQHGEGSCTLTVCSGRVLHDRAAAHA